MDCQVLQYKDAIATSMQNHFINYTFTMSLDPATYREVKAAPF